ncbi:DUF1080 domain-containing protein [Verrucomicrobia bacterium S94]|nr:DUF1080 domain-containing protein [Verrucomicrobia bacterium S94]
MKNLFFSVLCTSLLISATQANTISESQRIYIKKYEKQKTIPKPEEMLINTEKEPDICCGFTSLFNGKDLTGWTVRGGRHTFEVMDGAIKGTCVKGSPSTYLCTDKSDFKDFIFTCEMKWLVDGNSGVMLRAIAVPGGKQGFENVKGPQAEMEGFKPVSGAHRGWSGGIYGQGYGGWEYPLWLDAHAEARKQLKKDDWNRLTVKAEGDTIKTWINGVPAAHWKTTDYLEGFFGLQVHAGHQGTILWRNLKVKEL